MEQRIDWLAELEKCWSYELEQGGNSSPTKCTIWNDYGLSVSSEEGSAAEAIKVALAKGKLGEWA
jgi:hypothetical protein